MSTPLRPPGIIDRPHLLTLIDRRPVVVLAGMAGYGKSTLLAAAARRQSDRGAALWLTVDESDREPVRLVSDLLTAASLSGLDGLGAGLEPLRASALRAEPLTLVDSLLELLYDTAVPLTLVLDDLQHLAESKASVRVIDHVLRWAPVNMRIAIAARVVPPLRVQRLRLEDRLEYIAHDELAFSREESAEAVRAAGLHLDEDTVATIHRVTDGWPAGVRMAILAARQSGRPRQVPMQLRRDQALADYLATEVLASLSDDVRSFVLDSCLDEQVCSSLIDTIRGTHGSEAYLEQCLADGLFLTRGDVSSQEAWYHWHPLFAAHIRRRLATEMPERAVALHAAAAEWWARVDPPTAIRHAMVAGDEEMASRIFAERWSDLFLEGRIEAVLDAVEQLPEVHVYSSEAHLAKALILGQRGSHDAARSELEAARAAAKLLPEAARARLEDRMAIVELLRTGYDQGLGSAVESGVALLDRLDQRQRTPDPAIRAAVQVFVGMGEARLQSHPKLPLEMLRASAATAHESGLLALELTALAESCIPAIAEGNLTELHDLAAGVLTRAEERGWVGLVTLAPAVAYLGWFDYWRGNLRDAQVLLQRSLSMVLPFDWELRGLVLNFLTKTALSLGDLRTARRNAAEIASMIEAGHLAPSWPSMLAGLEGLILLAKGDTADAVALASRPPSSPEYRLAPALRAKVLLLAARPELALAELDRVPAPDGFVQIECLSRCIEAQAHATLGQSDAAHVSLELALAAAEPDELYGPFLGAGDAMTELLKSHLRHGTAHPTAVTHVLGLIVEGQHQNITGWGERLTDRERVILQYLATNLTNAEIAEAEYISLHTAKTHIAHIYQKLGVSSRRAAIRRAAELELY
jgi:LuxR family maltose regulon positive regulatory protein